MNSRMKEIFITSGIMVSLGVGGWFFWEYSAKEDQTPIASAMNTSQSNKDIEILRRELATVRNRLDQFEKEQADLSRLISQITRLEGRLESFLQKPSSTLLPQSELVAEAPMVESPVNTEEVDRPPDYISHVETAFWQEPEDQQWSLDTQADIAMALEDLEVTDTTLDQLQCHQTACRLEFVHPEGSSAATFIEQVQTAEPFFTNEFYAESIVGDDGKPRTLVYLARPGQSLFPNPLTSIEE